MAWKQQRKQQRRPQQQPSRDEFLALGNSMATTVSWVGLRTTTLSLRSDLDLDIILGFNQSSLSFKRSYAKREGELTFHFLVKTISNLLWCLLSMKQSGGSSSTHPIIPVLVKVPWTSANSHEFQSPEAHKRWVTSCWSF